MGQILNRISRMAKAEMNGSDDLRNIEIPEDDDEDLKRLIDSLKKNSTNSNYTEQNNFDNNLKLDAESAFRILGIYPNACNDEIKSAYKQRIKEYHPDKVAQLGAELRSLAEKKTSEINQAYEFLKKLRNF